MIVTSGKVQNGMEKRGRKKKGKRHFTHFTFTERLQIEAWLKTNTPVKTIAELLHKDRSSVYREINRGDYDRLDGNDYSVYRAYSPDIAEAKYRENLKAKGAPLKIGSDIEYADYIEHKITKEKYSPKAVLGEIKQEGLIFTTTISYTTLYRYIDEGVFLYLTNKDLPVKRNKTKKKYKKVKAARPPKGESIENRPKEVDERNAFGNWEMDCVVGEKTGGKVLLVLTERLTRREYVRLMPSKNMKNVVSILDKIEKNSAAICSQKFSGLSLLITAPSFRIVREWKDQSTGESAQRFFSAIRTAATSAAVTRTSTKWYAAGIQKEQALLN